MTLQRIGHGIALVVCIVLLGMIAGICGLLWRSAPNSDSCDAAKNKSAAGAEKAEPCVERADCGELYQQRWQLLARECAEQEALSRSGAVALDEVISSRLARDEANLTRLAAQKNIDEKNEAWARGILQVVAAHELYDLYTARFQAGALDAMTIRQRELAWIDAQVFLKQAERKFSNPTQAWNFAVKLLQSANAGTAAYPENLTDEMLQSLLQYQE